jgi:uncharacterized OsmC-like protein
MRAAGRFDFDFFERPPLVGFLLGAGRRAMREEGSTRGALALPGLSRNNPRVDPASHVEPDAPATAVREEGLRFRVTGPKGDVVSDVARPLGGADSAPSPGWLMRAGLAACDASLVAMEAEREGVELTELEVTVSSDSDSRGMLGVDDSVPPGPLSVRVHIRVAASNADEAQLRALVERADRRSAVRDAVAREVPVTTEVVVG